MFNTNDVTLTDIHPNDLGIVLSKSCNKLITTLPMEGYKKIYDLCDSITCIKKNKEANK